ncbi:MAG TPA: lipoyl synthase [Candidatus Saccharicenans sp.]|nr:lipoyl synthase [Candidatus Saccharicenans sp.]HQO75621.1 lipoyl synthase [Candidatus Saccharicenans sp.]HUM79397.1 lipoyl synthase [Candidatus Saccharicenans sp.]
MDHFRKPDWLKARLPSQSTYFQVAGLLKKGRLHTICESGRCPNIGECWARKTATFLILGNICTRNCAFCAVDKGQPKPLDQTEPEQVLAAVEAMGLRYVVITSVTRDDLPDGGAEVFYRTIKLIKDNYPQIKVEVLVPDFKGEEGPLLKVLAARPEVISHNLETTANLYPEINRPVNNYYRSLGLLKLAHEHGALTKSGLMVGLGESLTDLKQAFLDLRQNGCELLTIGQYLQPTRQHAPVRRYCSPQEFEELRQLALELGFKEVASGPLVRSSYFADKLYETGRS